MEFGYGVGVSVWYWLRFLISYVSSFLSLSNTASLNPSTSVKVTLLVFSADTNANGVFCKLSHYTY